MQRLWSRFASIEQYMRSSVLAALGVCAVALVPVFAQLSLHGELLAGALFACIIGALFLGIICVVSLRHNTVVIARSLLVLAPAPLLVVSLVSLVGGPTSRTFLFGSGFEFGTPGFFVLLLLGTIVGSAVPARGVRWFMRCVAITGAAGASIVLWHRILGGAQSVFEIQQLPLLLAAATLISVTYFDTGNRGVRVVYALFSFVTLTGFFLVRVPEAAIAGLVALGLISVSRFMLSGSHGRPFPILLFAAAAVFVSVLAFPQATPHTDFSSSERPEFKASADIVAQQYSLSLRSALIGTGPVSTPYAWNTYRPVSMNSTVWWNKTPQTTFSDATSVAMMFGFFGLAAFALLPIALCVMLVRNRNEENGYPPLFEATSVLAMCCILVAWIYPAGVTILLIGCVSFGMAVRHRSVEEVVRYTLGHDARIILFAVCAIASVFFLYTGSTQVRAMREHALGERYIQAGDIEESVIPLQRAALRWPTAQYQMSAAQATLADALAVAETQKSIGSVDLDAFGASATDAINFAESAFRNDPRNSDIALSRTALYALIFSAGFTSTQGFTDLPDTIRAQLNMIVVSAPTRADFKLNQAIFAKLQGDNAAAQVYAQEAMRLKPDYEEARTFLGSLAP